MKIRPGRAELYHADGWTETDGQKDMMKLMVAFRNLVTRLEYHISASSCFDHM